MAGFGVLTVLTLNVVHGLFAYTLLYKLVS